MQKLFLLALALTCAVTVRSEMLVKSEPIRPDRKITLFNGRDLSGWTKVITAEPGACPDATWSVADGVIRCTGKPFGYLMTQQSYADYRLHVEYRWYGTSDQMNSGIFIHKTGPDTFFLPKAIETQLKKDNAGDFVLLSQATLNNLTNPKNLRVEKIAPCSEKPVGEWNRVEITVRGNTLSSYINGVLQNSGNAIYTDAGQICLQSEGGPIEFRNITIEPIP
ncbi:MAG TPA: DUF1080 domain-containing protein [Kiritimatiellia bacterium]|jgi:hypothetical protein|nr:DUF1080 domain-containing protein [Kiritimatiellia bacterium]HOR98134.1 DUF1080 domain-containing protein [Kiritimatiellia bacterium]HPK36734.1 DUF1080 domain-containing protein [Kiritimatiellia bacterium]HPW75885.1 DUF1080 domain-containing protein [Kiritimatiellia bacterium]HRU19287.1 DUF1080 domain-containing protein [Kiritimatiellia bacterium]